MNVPPISLLFRFRDLVAPTVDEHRKVISAEGACWWGWWKRPSEHSRIDVWRDLKRTASVDVPVTVGLFDSGKGRVYPAQVTDVVLPTEDADERVPLPLGQDKLVPFYYRESPFSRAWMRLTEIGDSLPFFDHYTFAEAPQLPNFDLADLERFIDNVIHDPAELTRMDTTIWKVRPRRETDHETKIMLTTSGLKTAISAQPVACESNFVLHITDPHFALSPNHKQHVWRLESDRERSASSMVEAIIAALPRSQKIAFVLVTGDLTFTGETGEFTEARNALVRLLGTLNLDRDHLVVVPGNHDIRWSTNATYDEKAQITEATAQARENYEQFYRDLFGHAPNSHLSMGRRYVLPSGMLVEICALNSSSLEQGKNFLAGMGRTQEEAFGEVARALDWDHDESLALRVLALHHHLALTENLESPNDYAHGFGIATDAVRLQRLAARKGVQLAVHGHKHRAFVWRSRVYELPEHTQTKYDLGDLAIVGGGSAGSSDTDGRSNYFNVFNLTSCGVALDMYRSQQSGQFGRIQSWQASLELSAANKRLELCGWKVQP